MRAWAVALDAVLVAVGFLVFVYGDLMTHRGVRAGGVVMVTLAVVVAAVLSALRETAR